jgi:UDPglucose 6-dehydrogenase
VYYKDKINIGIIGQGFVGSAIRVGLKNFYTVKGYDLDPKRCYNIDRYHENGLKEIVEHSDIVFVCVPTPMRKDGSCDTRILESAIDDLIVVFNEQLKLSPISDAVMPIIVIKSTIPPGTTQRISDKYDSNLRICFSPEFLTEANSFEDFKN